MKKKLLLYLSKSNCSENIAVASTLAWLSKSQHYLFDKYYDTYHEGIHFPGGDSRNLETGQLTGGTVLGDRHFEQFYFILLSFDVSVITLGETIFLSCIKNLNTPIVSVSDRLNILYNNVFNYFNVSLPSNIVMIGCNFQRKLAGLEAYLYPEIYYRQAIGVPDCVDKDDLAFLYRQGSKIFCVYVDKKVFTNLLNQGYDVEVIDQLRKNDDYLNVTKRIALRWKEKIKGWIMGDPTLVTHWLPKACEEDLLSIYSVPQERLFSQFRSLLSSKGNVVYGRQYSDKDFFELSKLNQCLQVIDPYRPPFQSTKHAEYPWHTIQKEGFYKCEYSDEELRRFAREGRILVSLMFWSGMIREIVNFYNLMDLFAITKLRCGLVLTAQSYEYMMHTPLELLTIPLGQGGVYPLVEPVLGSCGIGVGIESLMTPEKLYENMREGLYRIQEKVKKDNYMPRGWWATMDANLKKLDWWKRPKVFQFQRYSPYFQMRFHQKERKLDHNTNFCDRHSGFSIKENLIEKLKERLRTVGLTKYFKSYRPYEIYQAGTIKETVVDVAKSLGLEYMFTKADFNSDPNAAYLCEDFLALNYTAGQWDGWTPFETVNDVSDLRKSEKKLLRNNKPGWVVSSIDACLWTFSGEFWRKGNKLYEIAEFCAEGGKSGELINTKPFTISRYARIIAEEKL